MHDQYPVTFEVTERPATFDRGHVLLRLAIMILISIIAAFAWVVALVYFVFPVVAASFISRDSDRFIREDAPRVKRWVHWIASFDAYLTFLTDRVPVDGPDVNSRMEVAYSGRPTVGSAVLRILTSIPSALVLALLSIAATITGIIAGIMILITETYPEPLYRFHTGVVRWGARLLAYHASLVDEYPPFDIDTDAPAPSAHVGPPAQEPA